MSPAAAQFVSFFFAITGFTCVLVWGFRKIADTMTTETERKTTVMHEMLADVPTQGPDGQAQEPGKGSFSRITGSIGTMALVAMFVGVSYWAIYALFFDPTNLTSLNELGTYFLTGSAMFMPYAFNLLSKVFKPTP